MYQSQRFQPAATDVAGRLMFYLIFFTSIALLWTNYRIGTRTAQWSLCMQVTTFDFHQRIMLFAVTYVTLMEPVYLHLNAEVHGDVNKRET